MAMTTDEVRWERMFPDQLEARFAACPVVWQPQGLCEPHGPQCALGLDALKAHGVAVRAALAHGGIVAPAYYWHIHETSGYADWAHMNAGGEVERTWLTAFPAWHHFKSVCYQVRQYEALGFKAAIFLTGHYGPNWMDLQTLMGWLQPHVGIRLHGLPDCEINEPGFDPEKPGETGDHAGRVETSLLWALEPDCVDMSRLPDAADPGPHFCMGRTARDSDRRVGERMVADEVAALGALAGDLLASYDAEPRERTYTTFSDVERVWHEHIRPRLGELRTMQSVWPGRDICPPESRWAANREIPDLLERGWG